MSERLMLTLYDLVLDAMVRTAIRETRINGRLDTCRIWFAQAEVIRREETR